MISSRVNVTAAIGALKAAAMPAATPDRGHAAGILLGERGETGEKARDTGADLDRGTFPAKRTTGADLHDAKHELADGITEGDRSGFEGVGAFDLGHTAAHGARNPEAQAEADTRPSWAGVRMVR